MDCCLQEQDSLNKPVICNGIIEQLRKAAFCCDRSSNAELKIRCLLLPPVCDSQVCVDSVGVVHVVTATAAANPRMHWNGFLWLRFMSGCTHQRVMMPCKSGFWHC